MKLVVLIFLILLTIDTIAIILLEKYRWVLKCKLFLLDELDKYVSKNIDDLKESFSVVLERIVGEEEAKEYLCGDLHLAFMNELYYALKVRNAPLVLFNPFVKTARDLVKNKDLLDIVQSV